MRGGGDLTGIVDHKSRARNADQFELASLGVGGGVERARDLFQDFGVGIVGT